MRDLATLPFDQWPIATYYVMDADMLGYVYHAEQPHVFHILATKGGVTTHGFASQLAFQPEIDSVRPATLDDFAAFRTHAPKGFA